MSEAAVQPKEAPPDGSPQPNGELIPFTCPWAQDGLNKAMEGIGGASTGVAGYKIGSRSVQYRSAGEQGKVVEYWLRMVEWYCGVGALPPWLSGRDSAIRVIPRDL